MPRKYDIDPVSPDNPVVFTDFSGHTLLSNSKALEIAGISKDTQNPDSGELERDPETNEPTGIFKELGAQALVSAAVPLLTREEKKQALLTALAHFRANGVTSFTDAAIGPGGEAYVYGVMSAEFVEIYLRMSNDPESLRRILAIPALGDAWRVRIDVMLQKAESAPPASD